MLQSLRSARAAVNFQIAANQSGRLESHERRKLLFGWAKGIWGIDVSKSKISRADHRRGAAMIELALFLPLFFMITMATVETCRVLYMRQSLTIASYECARLGIVPGMNRDALDAQCNVILQGRKIKGAVMTTVPKSLDALRYGDTLAVTITVGLDDNALLGTWFYRGRTLTETTTIMAEY